MQSDAFVEISGRVFPKATFLLCVPPPVLETFGLEIHPGEFAIFRDIRHFVFFIISPCESVIKRLIGGIAYCSATSPSLTASARHAVYLGRTRRFWRRTRASTDDLRIAWRCGGTRCRPPRECR